MVEILFSEAAALTTEHHRDRSSPVEVIKGGASARHRGHDYETPSPGRKESLVQRYSLRNREAE
jgi:hypothetical protein